MIRVPPRSNLTYTLFPSTTLCRSFEQLVTVAPSVNFGTYGGAARIAVRGIGFDTINPGSEGRVAYHVDGVYISRPSAQLGTFFDVDRVEVLRGPQGDRKSTRLNSSH